MRNLRSARPIFCFDSSTPEFCTRPRWSCDGESAWSILNKFQWLNRLPLNALLAPLGRADLIDAEPNLDLRFASMIDVKTTSTNLGISSARITRPKPDARARNFQQRTAVLSNLFDRRFPCNIVSVPAARSVSDSLPTASGKLSSMP